MSNRFQVRLARELSGIAVVNMIVAQDIDYFITSWVI